MKQKLFTLLTLLVLCVTGAWAGEEFTITPSLSKNNATLGYGLVTITKAGTVANCKFGSSKIQANSSSATFEFAIQTTYAGVTLKSITFNSIDKLAADGFTATGGTLDIDGSNATFTPTGDKNIATFTCVSASGKTGSVKITNILVDGGSNDIETIAPFAEKTGNDFGFTTKKNGGTVDNDVTISSADCTYSSPNISWGSNKVLTVSATENIKFVGLVADEDITKSSYVTTDVATYSNTAWIGSAKSISFTNSTGGGRTLSKIYLIKEAAVSCTISFDKGEGTGIAPADIVKNAGNNITLPKNFTMFKEGYTMTGWDADADGVADYAPGATYPVIADATLTAVYTSNGGTTLADRVGATEINFDFMQQDGAPSVTWSSGDHFWVAQATVGGKTIDVKADIAFGSGSPKFDNSAWNDWAQINDKTTFTIPSANGASVELISYNQDETTTVDGTALTSTGSAANYTCTADITSSASTVDVAFSGAGSYYKYIKVTLPGPTYDVAFTLNNVTKTSGEATVMGGTEYTATFAAADGYALPASVTVTAGGSDISTNCTWAKTTGTLTIPAAYTTGDIDITVNGVVIAGSEIIRATITAANTATPSGTIYKTTTTNLSGKDAGKSGWKFAVTGSYVLLTLADGYTFKKGDIVNVHITAAPGQGTMAIYSSGNDVLQDTGVKGGEGDNKIVLSADVDGQQSIKFLRTDGNKWNAHIDYISVSRPNNTITLNAAGYTTYSRATDFTFDGAKAYKMALNEGTKTIAGTEVSGKIAAGEGILLKGEAGAVVAITETTGASALDGNDLKGSTQAGGSLADKPTYCYVLSGNTFKNFTGAALTPNKAYFAASDDLSGHVFTMTFDDEQGDVTGINSVKGSELKANAYFDLQGRKVAQPTKGLYIVNGKKVVIK